MISMRRGLWRGSTWRTGQRMQAYPNYPVHGPTGPLAGELLKVVGDNLGAPKCPGVSRRRLLQGDITVGDCIELTAALEAGPLTNLSRGGRSLRREPTTAPRSRCPVVAGTGRSTPTTRERPGRRRALHPDQPSFRSSSPSMPPSTARPWVGRLLERANDPAAERAALAARQPHGRLVSADEVAYLASPAAASTTGTGGPQAGQHRQLLHLPAGRTAVQLPRVHGIAAAEDELSRLEITRETPATLGAKHISPTLQFEPSRSGDANPDDLSAPVTPGVNLATGEVPPGGRLARARPAGQHGRATASQADLRRPGRDSCPGRSHLVRERRPR